MRYKCKVEFDQIEKDMFNLLIHKNIKCKIVV